MPDQRQTIRFPAPMWAEIKAAAAREGVTANAWVVRWAPATLAAAAASAQVREKRPKGRPRGVPFGAGGSNPSAKVQH